MGQNVKQVHISELEQDRANANKGSERGTYMLEASFREVGAGRSILIDKHGRIIAGNKSAEQAAALGLDDVIVVESDGTKLIAVQRTDLDLYEDERARKLAYYDNRTSQFLEWDASVLLGDLTAGLDLSAMFRQDELDELLADLTPKTEGDTEPQIDRAEELRQAWGVEPGQLWQLGEHRLICGDCTDPATVARVMGGERAQGVFTSPPYAMQRKETYGGIPTDKYVDWWQQVQSSVRSILADSGSFFVNIKPHCEDRQRVLYVFDLVLSMVRQWGWRFVDELCWTHQGFPGEPQDRFQNAFEPVYHFAPTMGKIEFYPQAVAYDSDSVIKYEAGLNLRQRERSTAKLTEQKDVNHGAGRAYPRNVLKISSAASGMPDHPAAFPIALVSFFLSAYSTEGGVWFEPFSGSGTVIIACENLSRRCRAVEISPAYVAVALQRFLDHTGAQPVLLDS